MKLAAYINFINKFIKLVIVYLAEKIFISSPYLCN